MSSEAPLVPIAQREVDFYGDRLFAVEVLEAEGPVVYVPVRPICEFLGLDWRSQRARIHRDPVLSEVAKGGVIMTPPSADGRGGGPQEMLCLPVEFLHGWLFGITANKVKVDYRDAVLRYQRECYRVLSRVFSTVAEASVSAPTDPATLSNIRATGLAIAALAEQQMALEGRVITTEQRLNQAAIVVVDIRRRLVAVEQRVLPGHPITEEQAAELNLQVRALGELLRARGEGGDKPQQYIWSEMYRRFGIASYRNLPASKYPAALEFLEAWRLRVVQ